MNPTFYVWEDEYHRGYKESCKEAGRKLKKINPDVFYNETINAVYDAIVNKVCPQDALHIQFAEREWYRWGSPYYKVWPQMMHAMAATKIDIPSSFLKVPFPSFTIMLPKEGTGFFEPEKGARLASVLVHFVTSSSTIDHPDIDFTQMTRHGKDQVYVHYQFDNSPESKVPSYWIGFAINEGVSLNESIEYALDKTKAKYKNEYMPDYDFVRTVSRIAIAVCFFGVGEHELVMPDIPRKLIERWYRAKKDKNKSETEKLLKKGKKAGHFGWKVGSEIDLPVPEVKYKESPGRDREGRRELQFGHIRSGHMRLQPYGPRGKADHYELIFIPPTPIRPDLPVREMRGFKLQDNILRTRRSQ